MERREKGKEKKKSDGMESTDAVVAAPSDKRRSGSHTTQIKERDIKEAIPFCHISSVAP